MGKATAHSENPIDAAKTIYLVAGEASGDMYGGDVAAALLEGQSNTVLRGMGGDAMAAAGVDLVAHIRDASFMGFLEVLINLKKIRRTLRAVQSDIRSVQPDRVLTIDYPGFNLRLAAWCKRQGIPVDHYISPQVWAWKKRRIPKIAELFDRLYVILPFEQAVYAPHTHPGRFEVEFVGHPLLDRIPERTGPTSDTSARNWPASQNLDSRPVLGLFPGSRPQEIARMLPVLEAAALAFPGHQAVIAGAPGRKRSDYPTSLPVLFDQTVAIFEHAEAAWITSGTATLEAALHGLPHIIVYKTSWTTYQIARRLADVPFIGLANLILGRAAVPERIQVACTAAQLTADMRNLLSGSGGSANRQRAEFSSLRSTLGGHGAAHRVAKGLLRDSTASA